MVSQDLKIMLYTINMTDQIMYMILHILDLYIALQ